MLNYYYYYYYYYYIYTYVKVCSKQINMINMQDQNLGVWWLGVILEHGILEPVGYWPVILFNRPNN